MPVKQPKVKEIRYPKLYGLAMTFEDIGDVLPWHTHNPISAHITIVARGKFHMDCGHDIAGDRNITVSIDLSEGQCVDTPAGLFHEFTALTPNAMIYNIIKGDNEPESETTSTTGYDVSALAEGHI